jgi:hypothetical protein
VPAGIINRRSRFRADGVTVAMTPPASWPPQPGIDLALWHTLGLIHLPQPEDGPVMLVDYTG